MTHGMGGLGVFAILKETIFYYANIVITIFVFLYYFLSQLYYFSK